MSQPTGAQVHIDVGLTEVSQRIKNDKLIAEKVFPVITVKKDTDKIWIYGDEALHNEDDTYIPGQDANAGSWSVSAVDAYSLSSFRKKAPIVWEYRDNADDPIKYEADAVQIEREKQLLQLEKRVASKVLDINNYDGQTGDCAKTWDAVDSDPLADIDFARETVRDGSIKDPNTLILPRKAYNILRVHPKLIEMYKYVSGGRLSIEQMKELFEVENILIGESKIILNPAAPVVTNIWDAKKVALLYVAPQPGLQQISFGYIYRKTGYPFVERFDEVKLHTDHIYLNDKYDIKVQAKKAGFLLTECTA